jgi:hypothetical protein
MTRKEKVDLLYEWLGKYEKHFGKRYGISIAGGMSTEEFIEDIRKCIETNTPQSFFLQEGIFND